MWFLGGVEAREYSFMLGLRAGLTSGQVIRQVCLLTNVSAESTAVEEMKSHAQVLSGRLLVHRINTGPSESNLMTTGRTRRFGLGRLRALTRKETYP